MSRFSARTGVQVRHQPLGEAKRKGSSVRVPCHPGCDLGSGGHAELGEDVADVAGDGGAAEEEAGGDGRVAESLGDELGDLELAGGELAVAALGFGALVCPGPGGRLGRVRRRGLAPMAWKVSRAAMACSVSPSSSARQQPTRASSQGQGAARVSCSASSGGGVRRLDPEPRRGEGGEEEPVGFTVGRPQRSMTCWASSRRPSRMSASTCRGSMSRPISSPR